MCIVHPTSMTSSTIVAATTIDMTVKLGITRPKSIIQKIDNMRGDYNENKSTVIKKRGNKENERH
jgi:hypothetical protein